MVSSVAKRYWEAQAAHLERRINRDWCLQIFLPVATMVSIGASVTLLLFRQLELSLGIWSGGYLIALLLALGWALRQARPRFHTEEDALVRLEEHLGLNGRLSAAKEGATPWPEPPVEAPRPLHRHWGRLLMPLAASLALLLAGAVVPLGAKSAKALPAPVAPPASWQQVDAWVEALRGQELVSEESLAAAEEKLAQLRDRSPQEWYSQDSLEAGAALQEQIGQELATLSRGMEQAAGLLGGIAQLPPEARPQELDASIAQALAGMTGSGLSLNPELALQLQKAGQSDAQSLKKLQAQMLDGSKFCQSCLGSTEPGDLSQLGSGATIPLGSGGVERGPGHNPTPYGEASTLEANDQLGISNQNLDAPVLGEVIRVHEGGAPTPSGGFETRSGGATGADGSGGDVVWRQDLTPAERQVLQGYFQ